MTDSQSNESQIIAGLLNGEEKYWQISEFAKLVDDRAIQTVDGWFKDLENNLIHYVSREKNSGRKIYSELDLQILKFIDEGRKKKLPLDVIFSEIPKHFETRPFPTDSEQTMKSEGLDIEVFRTKLVSAATEAMGKQIAPILEAINQVAIAQQSLQLESNENKEKEKIEKKEQQLLNAILIKKIESKLRKEALDKWEQLPQEKRERRVGLFRKAEDIEKRSIFIDSYVVERIEDEIKKEMDDLRATFEEI